MHARRRDSAIPVMTRVRLLLVEDDPLISRFFSLALEDLPVDVVVAATLAQARQALADRPFGLLITDLMLPDGSGLELLADLHAAPASQPGLRTIVCGAGISGLVRQQAQALGAWRLLEKPVSLAALSVQQFAADADAGDAACRAGDAATLRRHAHNLKTVLLLLGADGASAQARALEAAAADPAADRASLETLWQTLRTAVLALG